MSIANSNVIAKVAAVVAGLGLVFSSFAYAVPAKAATTAELEAQVAALLAQIQALQGGSSASAGAAFTMDMTIGASGAEVTRLQNWLISKGYSIPAGATGYFGAQTAAAVAAYQKAKGITPAAGYFGPMTRAAVNAEGGSSTGGNTGGSTGGNTGGLQGGAGSVDDYSLVSGLNNEEVGEDEEDVEVAGLEIEVDEGSDIELTAVRLVFDEGTGATSDFEDYASEVSIWLDGEEVARVDGDEFNDDNEWTSTISLDGAVIEAGETAELIVAISGQSNLDSGDSTDEWSVDFRQVRFKDADGATVSEDPSVAATTFSFELFATAADVGFKLSAGEDEDTVNEAHVIDVDDSDDTDAEILSFNVEVEGDSDITLDALPVNLDVTGATNVDDMISGLSLWLDGEEVGTASVSGDCEDDADCSAVGADETYLFDDMDLTLDAGEEYEFIVMVELKSTGDVDLDAGDTIAANIGEALLEAGANNFDAEDESGEDLAAADISGTVTGEASAVYDNGIMVEFVSADATVDAGDPTATNDHDLATFTFVFDVTAFGSDINIDNDDPTLAGGTTHDLTLTSGSGTLVDSDITSTGADEGTNSFTVEEDETERFTITAVVTPTTDGLFQLELDGILYIVNSDASGDTNYTFNLDEFETDSVYLNNDAA